MKAPHVWKSAPKQLGISTACGGLSVLIQIWRSCSSSSRLQGRLTSSQVRANSKDFRKSLCSILGSGNLWRPVRPGPHLVPSGSPRECWISSLSLDPSATFHLSRTGGRWEDLRPLCMWGSARVLSTGFTFFLTTWDHIFLQLFLVSKSVMVIFFYRFYPRVNLLLSQPSSTRWTVWNQGTGSI